MDLTNWGTIISKANHYTQLKLLGRHTLSNEPGSSKNQKRLFNAHASHSTGLYGLVVTNLCSLIFMAGYLLGVSHIAKTGFLD
jgi:hypothetical protein